MDIKTAILKKGILIKIGVIVLATIILLLAGLGSLSLYKVIVCDLPLFEECPEDPYQDGEYVPGQIIVKFKPGTTPEAENQLNQSLGTSVIFVSPSGGFKVLEIPQEKTVAEMVDIYNQQSIVEYAEPNYIEHENRGFRIMKKVSMWYRKKVRVFGLISLTLLVLITIGSGSISVYILGADELPIVGEYTRPPDLTADYVPGEIIVMFRDGISSNTEMQLNQSLATTVSYTSPFSGYKILKIPVDKSVSEMVNIYANNPLVEYAEPNYIDHITYAPNDTLYSLQWHFDQINLESAWDLDTTSPLYGGDPSIIVAVIDTGVAYEDYDETGAPAYDYLQAPDLANTNFWVNSGETAGNSIDDDGNGYTDDINGWDFVNNDAHPNDDDSHGTHVTGTIAQSTNNSLGVAGIAFNTTIMPLKTLGPGGGTVAQLSDAFHYAADNGANIINYSGGGDHSITKQNAVIYASNAGVIIIAAAGNDYPDTAPLYPAAYDDYVIAVGATDYDQAHAPYSNTGTYLDIAAPGGDTSADQNNDTYADGVLQQTINPLTSDPTDLGYWFFDGTSMATPHVAGVAALILAQNPTWTASQVRYAIESSAIDIGDVGWDEVFGWGLLNAYAAVNSTLSVTDAYSDFGHTTEYLTEHIVYMYTTDLLPSYGYRMAYYDGSGTKRVTEDETSDSSGNLLTQHTFVDGVDIAGTWNVIVCDQNHIPPTSFDSTWTYLISQDSFTVQQSAIPEFPTALAALVVMAASAGIYLWMRKKALPVAA